MRLISLLITSVAKKISDKGNELFIIIIFIFTSTVVGLEDWRH